MQRHVAVFFERPRSATLEYTLLHYKFVVESNRTIGFCHTFRQILWRHHFHQGAAHGGG